MVLYLDLSIPSPSLDHGSIDITEDADIRSPRTPVYQSKMPLSSGLSPFDPAKLFSSLSAPLTPRAVETRTRSLPPVPSDPLAWMWQCHLCRSRWPLGVTQRCLIDGHLYCSGEISQPNLKKKSKGQSCSSEFDYVGWKEWGVWKRSALKAMSNPRIPEGCMECEFPSQCRYALAEKESMDEQLSRSSVTDVAHSSTPTEADVVRYYSNEQVTFESVLAKAEAASKSMQSKMTDYWGVDKPSRRSKSADGRHEAIVVGRAERRGSQKPSLASVEEEASSSESDTALQDLVMPLVDIQGHSKAKRKSVPLV